MRAAKECRVQDLRRLFVLCHLVGGIGELIHQLQKERGASSIYLGSNGRQFSELLIARVAEARELETRVRLHLEHIDEKLEGLSCGARFYARVALAFCGLDLLPPLRENIR